jgi:hypothetical protein
MLTLQMVAFVVFLGSFRFTVQLVSNFHETNDDGPGFLDNDSPSIKLFIAPLMKLIRSHGDSG